MCGGLGLHSFSKKDLILINKYFLKCFDDNLNNMKLKDLQRQAAFFKSLPQFNTMSWDYLRGAKSQEE